MRSAEVRALSIRAAKIGVGLFVFWLAFRDVTLASLRDSLRGVDWRWLAAAAASTVATVGALTLRWTILLNRTLEYGAGRVLFAAIVVAQAANIIAPFKLGDAARIAAVSRRLRLPAADVLGSVAVERLFDALAVALTAAALIWAGELPPFARSGMISALCIVAAGFGVLAAVRIAFRGGRTAASARWIPARLKRQADGMLAGLERVASARVLLMTLAASGLVMAASILTCLLVVQAFGLGLPLVAAAVLVIVLQIGNAVAPVPGAIGIAQVLTAQTLAVWNIAEPTGLAFALVLYVVARLPKIVLLPLMLPALRTDRQEP